MWVSIVLAVVGSQAGWWLSKLIMGNNWETEPSAALHLEVVSVSGERMTGMNIFTGTELWILWSFALICMRQIKITYLWSHNSCDSSCSILQKLKKKTTQKDRRPMFQIQPRRIKKRIAIGLLRWVFYYCIRVSKSCMCWFLLEKVILSS